MKLFFLFIFHWDILADFGLFCLKTAEDVTDARFLGSLRKPPVALREGPFTESESFAKEFSMKETAQ